MKRYAINYEETYSGTFTVELDDDSTEQDAINELLNNADEYRLGEQVELSDSDAQVIKTENVEDCLMTDTMEQVTEDVLDAFKRNGWIVVAPKNCN